MSAPDSYRGWSISFDYGYFNAFGPNYDASWEGEEDGWVGNGEHVTARTREGLIEEIDARLEEVDVCMNCGAYFQWRKGQKAQRCWECLRGMEPNA